MREPTGGPLSRGITRLAWLGLGVACLALAACTARPPTTRAGSASAPAKLQVACTSGPITDAVRVVGGERVAVHGLMGPGVDPHLYKARLSDLALLTESDVVFYEGLHLEAKLADVLEKLAGRVDTVPLGAAIPAEHLIAATAGGPPDPHVWFDVSLWKYVVQAAADNLARVDPAGAAEYVARAQAYLVQLDELDAYVRQRVAEVPAEQRVLITAHDAFHYFGRAYGFEVLGLQGISTNAEAGTADVQHLAQLITDRQIKAIFVESSVPLKNITALIEAVHSRGWEVRVGGELYSDALGERDGPGGSYLGMVRHNIDTIVGALTGADPAPPEVR